ncbi:Glycogen synthase [Serratia fonticola]|uniref:glycosyltransferase n=1 Tax=Serratia fonticola TaxID=47917 RepID=UPI0021835ADF|nr:glycosyltransferase [Serratia fonticola]CAI2136827.1 Glycogen synthase [Serratia fonticola]
MKILHVAETIKGGVATVIRQLVAKKTGDELFCLIPHDQKSELSGDNEKILTFIRTGRNAKSFLSLASLFIRIVINDRPDVIHIHSSFAGVICRTLLMFTFFIYRPRVIYCPHAFSFLMDISTTKKKIYALLEKILQSVTDEIICVSNHEKMQAIHYGLSPKKLKVIYNGVTAPVSNVDEFKSPFNSNRVNILFVGRLDYQKGFDIVLQLADKLNDEFLITVIGATVHAKDTFANHPLIDFKGWLKSDEIAPYFYFADVLIMPSRWESFGLVAVEAQSYGLPVIASNTTSLPEVVLDKKTGFLFPNEDANMLYNILISHNKTDWIKMGGDCFDFYKKNFTSERMIDETYRLYKG